MSNSRAANGRPSGTTVRGNGSAAARGLVVAVAAVGTGAVAGVPAAHAGTFEVSQCSRVSGGTLAQAAGYQSAVWQESGVPSYLSGCTGDGNAQGVYFPNRRLGHSEAADHVLTVPASMPGTSISSVDVSYTVHQQSASTNPAYFSVFANGSSLLSHNMTGFTVTNPGSRHRTPDGSRNVQFNVWCSPVNGPGFCNWTGDAYAIRGLTLQLEESGLPSTDASGPLLSAGDQAGSRPLEVSAADDDSGIKSVVVTLDGVNVGSFDFSGSCRIDRFRPCPPSVVQGIDVDTTRVRDGSRLLRLVVTDLAGNTRTVDKGYVAVENVPAPANRTLPAISGEKRINRTLTATRGAWTGDGVTFAYRWQRHASGSWENIADAIAETFRTTRHEVGMRLRLRVTASNAEGSTVAYSDETEPILAAGPTDADGDFDGDTIANQDDPDDDGDGVADVSDVAPFDRSIPGSTDPSRGGSSANPTIIVQPSGGTTSTTTNTTTNTSNVYGTVPNGFNHSVKALTRFEGSRVRNLRHGAPTVIRGRLIDEGGRGIGTAALTVSERRVIPSAGFAEGSTMTPVGTIVTRDDGSFAYTAKAGTSRTIQFGYRAFKDAGEFAWTTDVTLLVAGKATLGVDRASIRNGQSVRFSGRVAAPVPSAGVPVVLQARTSRGWVTFKTTRARGKGRYAAAYRFTSTTSTRTYQFRAKVMGDSSYAYKAATTRVVRVRVRGR